MAKVTFYIDKNNPNKENLVPIVANVTIEGKKVKKNIERIKNRYWNKKTQRVIPPKPQEPDNGYKRINNQLDSIEHTVKTYFRNVLESGKTISNEILSANIKQILSGQQVTEPNTSNEFWAAFDEYIQEGTTKKAAKTTTGIKTTYNKLKTYEETRNTVLTFEGINENFYSDFNKFILFELEHHYNNLAASIKRLKAFLNWSTEKGYNTNIEYRRKTFSTPEKEGTVIYLTWPELQTLINYPFEKEVHRKTRDFFCFGCLTGQRYSDIIKLTKNNLDTAENVLKIIQQKTKKEISIPVHPGMKTIIDRYQEQFRLLPKFSNQKANKYIKEVCKIAEINTPTEYKTFVNHETRTNIEPKYDLIGTHTARKTFICLAYERGLTIEDIKEITGITQEKTLRRYLAISTETKRAKLVKAFNGL